MRKTANYVNGEAVSFGSAFEEALSEFDLPRALKSEQKEAISTLVSGKDQLAVLPTGFGKNLLFQVMVCIRRGNLQAQLWFVRFNRKSIFDGINGNYAHRLSFGGYRVRQISTRICVSRERFRFTRVCHFASNKLWRINLRVQLFVASKYRLRSNEEKSADRLPSALFLYMAL